MAIYKRCDKCRKRLPSGTKCTCITKRVYPKNSPGEDKHKDFYKTSAWVTARDNARAFYDGLDIYSYYVLGRIEYGATVHHIEEIRSNWERRLDPNNLIYLTDSNHQIIHGLMRQSTKDKEDIQTLLSQLRQRYVEEFKPEQGAYRGSI